MSEEYEKFQHVIFRNQLPFLALDYIEENEDDIRSQLKSITVPSNRFYGMNIADLLHELAYSVACSTLVLGKQVLEEYCYGVHKGDRDGSDIIQKLPEYKMRCVPTGKEYHIVQILKDVRDRFIHTRNEYNMIECEKSSLEVWTQKLIVKKFDDYRKIHFCPEGTIKGLREISSGDGQKMMTLTTFGEFLLDELVECIEEYDSLRTPKGFKKRKRKLSSRIVYE